MSNRKRKLPPIDTPNVKVMRQVAAGPSMTAVVASETPVERYDEQRGIVVKEVLLMSGLELRGSRDQLPIVDSHNDRTVRNIFGSIRRLRIEGDKLVGDTSFASDAESQTIAQRMAEGHITDFSITADVLESIFIQRGQSYTTSLGQYIEGPAVIVTRWQPLNASICATGADVNSTVRRSYTDLHRKVTRMDEAMLGQLSAMGLPEGMTDPNQVLAWVVGKLSASEVEEASEPMAPIENAVEVPPAAPAAEAPAEEKKMEEPVMNSVARSVTEVQSEIKRALESDQKRRTEIQSACTLAKIERAFADELCNAFVSVSEARKRIIERMATQPLGSSVGGEVRVTESADDKFYAAARDGLLMRAAQSAGVTRNIFGTDKPSAGADDFRYQSLGRMAETFARRMGAPVERMAQKDIALVAMGHPGTMNRLRIQRSDSAYHTTGSFANLLLDAANKTLLAGYEEAEYTWNIWARQAPAVADFKNINRIRFSESPDLEMVPELGDYKEGTMSDSKETYKVEKFGKMFSVSWETVINDDLDAIGRIPAMQGVAARRTQNRKVYEVLTSNPTMGDSYSLFSASHASGDNTSGAAAAPSVTTLNAAFVKMRTQKGLNSTVTLNISPKFLIVPVAYEATAMELFGSTSYNAANNNEGVKNIYGPGGGRALTLVSDPVLDASSATVWYLAAANTNIDTVELAFLQGEESPVLENEWDFDKDAYRYKVRQTFGVKAIDWRGLYRNAA